jgi:phage shock protein A
MSLWSRLKLIFRSKASRALDRAEDPGETLDYSYQRQVELLQDMRRGIAEVTTARKRIEMQAQGLQRSHAKLEGQARQALEQHREDLAREALTRRAGIAREIVDLQAQHEQLRTQEDKMIQGSRALEAKLQQLRTRKETIKASYSAAEAQTRVTEASMGISKEMSELGLAVQRAEDKIASMQARSAALDELMASGALEDLSADSDRIQAELDMMAAKSEVESELTRLQRELSPPSVALGPGHSDIKVDRPAQEPARRDDQDRP